VHLDGRGFSILVLVLCRDSWIQMEMCGGGGGAFCNLYLIIFSFSYLVLSLLGCQSSGGHFEDEDSRHPADCWTTARPLIDLRVYRTL
jgi:hypothetical protein